MANQVDICNIAILDAGGNTINSIPDGTKKESDLVVAHYDTALDLVLGEHPWRFAKKWSSLAENAGYTFIDDTYGSAWALPSDFIRFSDLENVGPSSIKFARRDTHLLTEDLDEFEIEYIARIEDTTKFPSYFIVVFAAYLSFKFAPSLRRKGSKDKVDFFQNYLFWLNQARMKDSREDKQLTERQQRHTESNDTWIQARG